MYRYGGLSRINKNRHNPMYNYWRSNKNVILTAVALFMVSLTALLYVLTGDITGEHGGLSANVVDSISIKSQMEQEKVFRSMVDDHVGPLAVVETHGLIEFASWDFESTTGYKAEAIKNQLFYSFIHPEDMPQFLAALGKVIATGEEVPMVGPYRIRTSEGDYRMQVASFYPIKNAEGETENIIFAIQDLTENIEPEISEEEENSGSNDKSIRNMEEEDDTRLVVEKV